MFRVLTHFLSFLGLLTVLASSYSWVLNSAQTQSCNGFVGCYQLIAENGLLSVPVIELVSLFSIALMGVVALCIVVCSFALIKKRTKLFMSAVVLALLVAVQVCLSLNHEAVLPNQALEYFVRYVVGVLIVGISLYMALRSQLNYEKKSLKTKSYWLQSVMGLLALQVMLGAWLTANHAGLTCSGFPQCNGSWWPRANYQYAFDLLSSLSFDAKVALSWVHRILALLNFLTLTWVFLSVTKHSIKQVRWAGLFGSFSLLLLITSGIASVKIAMPAWLMIAHSLLAVALVMALLLIHFYTRYAVLSDISEIDEDVIADVALEALVEPEPVVEESIYGRLKSQLGRTRSGFGAALSTLSLSNRKIDQDLLEEIETSLLIADVGLDVTTEIIEKIEESVEKHQLQDAAALSALLKQELLDILKPVSQPLLIPEQEGPYVILVVGINGVGKTTTIGKLAQRLQREGHSVMLAAGDTFRAAAVEQLQVWGERNNIHVVAQHTGADSASVIFDGVQSAKAKGVDVLIADTAGRLHTKTNLMDELKKVKRIISRLDEAAPHEVLLVLDAGTGQNALSQTEHFNKTVNLTGLALTKLDGTAKGGMIFALAKQHGIPIRFLGVGEGIDDLQDFNAEQFVDALFMEEEK